MIANGRDQINLMGHEFIGEREAASCIGVSVMRLRRSVVLQSELRHTRINTHNYYMLSEVKRVQIALSKYVLRKNLKPKPQTTEERKRLNETVIFGLIVYPKRRVARRG